jgi:hypothetical protein
LALRENTLLNDFLDAKSFIVCEAILNTFNSALSLICFFAYRFQESLLFKSEIELSQYSVSEYIEILLQSFPEEFITIE